MATPSSSRFAKKIKPYLLAATCLLTCMELYATMDDGDWIADILRHFTVQYLVGAFFLSLAWAAIREIPWAILTFGIMALNAHLLMPWWNTQPPVAKEAAVPVSIFQYNVYQYNRKPEAATDWLLAQEKPFDIVILLEVSDENIGAFAKLKERYRYFTVATDKNYRGTAVFTNLPNSHLAITRIAGYLSPYVTLTSTVNAKPFILYAIHPPSPISHNNTILRNQLFATVADEAAKTRHAGVSTLIVGDFNSTPWSPAFSRLTQESGLRDAQNGQGFTHSWPTYLPAFMGIAIDHLLISPNIAVEKRKTGPDLGSDHLPIISTLYVR